jgi:hypothetical protein
VYINYLHTLLVNENSMERRKHAVKCEVFTAVTMKNVVVFWDVALCRF